MELTGYIASALMGVVLGLMGGGGAILTVPIMVYLFQVPPATATGYSLFVVGSTALIGSFAYVKRGDVDLKTALAFATPSVAGVYVSRAFIVPSLPPVIAKVGSWTVTNDILIMAAFATLMILASLSMIKARKPASPLKPASAHLALIAAEGLVVGLIAGFVGAGGGFLIVPALVFFAGLSMRVAVGTSLVIIAVQSLLGFTGDLGRGAAIDWPLLMAVATVAAAGIVGGSVLSHRVPEQKLKIAFGWFVLIMGSTILIEQIRR